MCVFVEKWNIISLFIHKIFVYSLSQKITGNGHETKFHLKAEAKWSKMRALQVSSYWLTAAYREA